METSLSGAALKWQTKQVALIPTKGEHATFLMKHGVLLSVTQTSA